MQARLFGFIITILLLLHLQPLFRDAVQHSRQRHSLRARLGFQSHLGLWVNPPTVHFGLRHALHRSATCGAASRVQHGFPRRVTALTDNGAEISTLAMRGLVSLPPAVGWRRSQ